MRFLVDTNLWLEVLLNKQRAQEVRLFFEQRDGSDLVLNPVNPFFRFAGHCTEFKIGHGAPDGNVGLCTSPVLPQRNYTSLASIVKEAQNYRRHP